MVTMPSLSSPAIENFFLISFITDYFCLIFNFIKMESLQYGPFHSILLCSTLCLWDLSWYM
jgi:hypothetical protein